MWAGSRRPRVPKGTVPSVTAEANIDGFCDFFICTFFGMYTVAFSTIEYAEGVRVCITEANSINYFYLSSSYAPVPCILLRPLKKNSG